MKKGREPDSLPPLASALLVITLLHESMLMLMSLRTKSRVGFEPEAFLSLETALVGQRSNSDEWWELARLLGITSTIAGRSKCFRARLV